MEARLTGLANMFVTILALAMGTLFVGCYTELETRPDGPSALNAPAYSAPSPALNDSEQVTSESVSQAGQANSPTAGQSSLDNALLLNQDGTVMASNVSNYLLYLDKKKDTGGGIAWWLILPGAGPMYAHDYTAGWIFATCDVASLGGMLFAKKGNSAATFAGVFAISRLVELPWTIVAVGNYNASLRSQLFISNVALGSGRSMQSGVRLSFSF